MVVVDDLFLCVVVCFFLREKLEVFVVGFWEAHPHSKEVNQFFFGFLCVGAHVAVRQMSSRNGLVRRSRETGL